MNPPAISLALIHFLVTPFLVWIMFFLTATLFYFCDDVFFLMHIHFFLLLFCLSTQISRTLANFLLFSSLLTLCLYIFTSFFALFTFYQMCNLFFFGCFFLLYFVSYYADFLKSTWLLLAQFVLLFCCSPFFVTSFFCVC